GPANSTAEFRAITLPMGTDNLAMSLASDTLPIYRQSINDRTGRIMRDFRNMHEERMRGFGFGWRGPFPHGHGHGPQGRGRGRDRGGRRGNVRAALLALLTGGRMHGCEGRKDE